MSEIINLNADNFDKEVKESKLPVLVDFWATWCGPCKMQGPIFEELAGEYGGKIKFAKANVEDTMDIAGAYGVTSIPTIILFNEGKVISKSVGLQEKQDLLKIIEAGM